MYDKDLFPLLAEKYAREGMKDEDIAKALGIGVSTFYHYQDKHKEFLEALKRGKLPVNVKVENALLKRALGYEIEETTKTMDIVNGSPKIKEVKTITKHIQPDVGAIAFWLKNRSSKEWKDRQTIEFENGMFSDEEKKNIKAMEDEIKRAAGRH